MPREWRVANWESYSLFATRLPELRRQFHAAPGAAGSEAREQSALDAARV